MDLTKEEYENLIKNEILHFESECIRPIREFILGINKEQNIKKLNDINSEITELRKRLKSNSN